MIREVVRAGTSKGRWAVAISAILSLTSAILSLMAADVAASQRDAGALDSRFGNRGTVITARGEPRVSVADVAKGADGGIYVAANTARAGLNLDGGRLLLLHYDRRGRLVRRFGRGGVVRLALGQGPATARAVARQRDGWILVVGSAGRAR